MPFKHHVEHRHHIPKPRYRVTNWPEYDAALRQRGSLTVWFTDETIAAWQAEPRTTPGGQPQYSALVHKSAGVGLTEDEAWGTEAARQLLGKRFAKKQQMQWSKEGAHLLPQTRTQTLDGSLRGMFTRWYPAMAANDPVQAPLSAAA